MTQGQPKRGNRSGKPGRPASRRPHGFETLLKAQDEIIAPVSTLLYGPSGAGKTTALGSAAFDARTSPILVLDFEGGAKSIQGIAKEKMTVVRLHDVDDLSNAYDYLRRGDHPFKAVAIDSLSELHAHVVQGIASSESEKTSRREDPYQYEIADYGKALNQMREIVRRFRNLPMHTIFTALAKSQVEPREGRVKKPLFYGSFSEEMPGMVDVCGYISAERPEKVSPGDKTFTANRTLILKDYPGVRAKIRTVWGDDVPPSIPVTRETTVKSIFDLLKVPMP